uniref:Family with sequence similarity 169 member B n=2 Tax=Ornithorhynchus anatinus TaxID=9258 RepID=A0A6I8NA51_ORNAN
MQEAAEIYYSKLGELNATSPEFCLVFAGQKVKLEDFSICFIPVYRDEPNSKILVLVNPQDRKKVLAVFLNHSWWPIEDIMKTSDPAREGLIKVQSFIERIVLFILNHVIFGRLERNLNDDMFFLPHSAKEHAKIFWKNGDAAGFYTLKMKGSLCGNNTCESYQLPVLDTAFIRRKYRGQGLGITMLNDFCQSFVSEDALGISYPISDAMYRVCRRFLLTHPEEQERLWEVEAPGDWGQRLSIWLKIQLEQGPSDRSRAHQTTSEEKEGCHANRSQDDEHRQLDNGEMNKSKDSRKTTQETKNNYELIVREGKEVTLQLAEEEDFNQDSVNTPLGQNSKRSSEGADLTDYVDAKHIRPNP